MTEHVAINGEFPDVSLPRRFPLVIADPPYGNVLSTRWDLTDLDDVGFSEWMLNWTKHIAENLLLPGGALYVWGGIGKPLFRPFYRYLVEVEHRTELRLANHITWKKKRAYGIQHNYLFTREELAYFVFGDIKKPRTFHVPLLDEKRGYAGYNKKYPAKSEFLRRSNVWTDVTEILRGKLHEAEKPVKLHEIIIAAHTEPGEWVLDPFAGSGTTGIAAHNLGRNSVLVEKDPAIYKGLMERLA